MASLHTIQPSFHPNRTIPLKQNTKCGALLKLLGLPQYYEEKEEERETNRKRRRKWKNKKKGGEKEEEEEKSSSGVDFFLKWSKWRRRITHSVIYNSQLDHPDNDQIWPYCYINNINTQIKSGHIVILATPAF